MESTFRANERKIKSSKARCSGKGTDEIYKPKWDYYELLLFLKKTCAQSDTIDNLSSQSHISTSNSESRSSSNISQPAIQSSMLANIYYDENQVSIEVSLFCLFMLILNINYVKMCCSSVVLFNLI